MFGVVGASVGSELNVDCDGLVFVDGGNVDDGLTVLGRDGVEPFVGGLDGGSVALLGGLGVGLGVGPGVGLGVPWVLFGGRVVTFGLVVGKTVGNVEGVLASVWFGCVGGSVDGEVVGS